MFPRQIKTNGKLVAKTTNFSTYGILASMKAQFGQSFSTVACHDILGLQILGLQTYNS